MPSVNDWDKSDDDSSGGGDSGFTPAQSTSVGSSNSAPSGGSSSGSGSATGAPKQAAPEKQQDDGYVPWSSFVNANQDVSNREAGKLAGQVQGDVTKAQSDLSGAQQSFDSGYSENYNQPAAKGAPAPQQPKTKQPSSEQSTPTSAQTPSQQQWGSLSMPAPAPTAAAGRQPARTQAATYTPPTVPVNGGHIPVAPNMDPTPPAQSQSRQRAVTPQNAAAAGVPWSSIATPAAPPAPTGDSGASDNSSSTHDARHGWAGAKGPQPQPATHALSAPGVAARAPAQSTTMPTTTPGAQAMFGYGRSQQLTPGAASGNPAGKPDLESAAGQQAWGQLLGDTTKAQQEAHALGSETGVQGLLQQNASTPTNSAFDAALINGQGGPQFQALAGKYGGNQLDQNIVNAEQASQDKWAQLLGDEKTRQAFDAAKAAAPAPGMAATPLATSGQTGPSISSFVSSTSGANGQFDPSGFPANFDPTSDPKYQSAMQQLEQASPLPSYASTPDALLHSQEATNFWPTWAQELGMTPDALTNLVKNMPQWQYELFARGIVPAGVDRSGGKGYFEGFSPVSVQATGKQSDADKAMQILESVIVSLANPVAGAAFKGAQEAVASNAANPNNKGDPFGNRG